MTATAEHHENPIHVLAVITPGLHPHLVVLSALARRAEGRPDPAPTSAAESVSDRLRI